MKYINEVTITIIEILGQIHIDHPVVPNLLSLIDGVKCKGNSSMLPICPEPKDFSRINCCRTNLNLFERSSKWSGRRAPIEKSGLR